MQKLSFRRQFYIGLAIVIACFILSTVFKRGFISNIGWVIDGLLFVIHPVCPEAWKWKYAGDEKRMKRDFRIAGCVVILFGLITKYSV